MPIMSSTFSQTRDVMEHFVKYTEGEFLDFGARVRW